MTERDPRFQPPGQMSCSACSWWPPLVGVRHGKTERASDAWRWRELKAHVEIATADEERDGNYDGPHGKLARLLEEIRASL